MAHRSYTITVTAHDEPIKASCSEVGMTSLGAVCDVNTLAFDLKPREVATFDIESAEALLEVSYPGVNNGLKGRWRFVTPEEDEALEALAQGKATLQLHGDGRG